MSVQKIIFACLVTTLSIAATFSALLTHSEAQSVNSRAQNTNSRPVSEKPAERKGTSLVKTLPVGVQGVEFKNGMVRAKPGFKFEKQADGSFAVMRMSGGGLNDSGGGWKCDCSEGTGECFATMYTDGRLGCTANGCAKCKLNVTVNKKKFGIMMY
jgi:uncharacterized protein (DUF2147 family)